MFKTAFFLSGRIYVMQSHPIPSGHVQIWSANRQSTFSHFHCRKVIHSPAKDGGVVADRQGERGGESGKSFVQGAWASSGAEGMAGASFAWVLGRSSLSGGLGATPYLTRLRLAPGPVAPPPVGIPRISLFPHFLRRERKVSQFPFSCGRFLKKVLAVRLP
ncbi:hypothetical protein CEXT_639261 [Caerostris extrusa]|uniref:Uncharacterized protein n=1 Tax=Caerostris extrusa TaxID=172846 RepID=A0AAV4SKD2_CAEEX|nr:hypothetical protein CEXT_639261 [Caerostris extrusa]